MVPTPPPSPKKPPARRKRSKKVKYKKAPQAPKRFKSSYMFYSTEKHKEIREQLGERASTEKTTNVAKMVSEAWKNLTDDEREKWEALARQDKARYEHEKSLYNGPWKVLASDKPRKDPSAPKRPMSAFLAFSNAKRREVQAMHPQKNNTDISRILAQMWKVAPERERSPFINEEQRLREEYKEAIAAWRAKREKEEENTRQQQREADRASHAIAAQYQQHQQLPSREASLSDSGPRSSDIQQYQQAAAIMGNMSYSGAASAQYPGQYWQHQDSYSSAAMQYPQYSYQPPRMDWPQQVDPSQLQHTMVQAGGVASYPPGSEYYDPTHQAGQYQYPPEEYDDGTQQYGQQPDQYYYTR